MYVPLLAVCLTPTAAAAGFSTAITRPSGGSGPDYLAVGDLNGDGFSDVVISNKASNNLQVFLGTGGGKFAAPIQIDLVPSDLGYPVAIGDFNRDGKLDIAAVNARSGDVYVFLGNGNGTFSDPVITPMVQLGGSILSLTAADFDSDGNLDLYLGGNGGSQILLGNGDGSFTQQPIGPTNGGLQVAVGDFNGDGHLDAGGAWFGGMQISLGNGDGTFQAPTTYQAINAGDPSGMTVGDFNNDGKLDVATVSFSSDSVTIFLGNGDGTFQPPITSFAGSGPGGIAAADFDGDGLLDLAVTDYNSGGTGLLKGLGDGSFAFVNTSATGTNPVQLASAYFDANGSPDLAVTNYGADTFSILNNQAGFSDFQLRSPTPPAIELAPGNASNPVVIQIGSLGSFTSTVSLSCGNLQFGVTCSFLPSSTVTPRAGAPVDVSVSLNSPAQVAASFTFQIIGASQAGKETHNLSASAVLPSFRILSVSGTQPLGFPGQTVDFDLRLKNNGDYHSLVSLSCQPGATAPPPLCSPSQAMLTPSAAFELMLSSPVAQDYSFFLQGVGSDPHSITDQLPVTFSVMEYALSAPATDPVVTQPGQVFQDSVTVSFSNNFLGAVTLTCLPNSPLVQCTLIPSLVYPVSPPRPSFFQVTVAPNAPGGIYTLTLQALADGDSRPPKSVQLTIQVQDYTIAVSPPTRSYFPGETAALDGVLTAIQGFSTAVNLACSAGSTNPPALCSITPATTTPSSSGTFILMTSDNNIGNYNFNVAGNAVSGGFHHELPVNLRVADISLNRMVPASVAVTTGNLSQPITAVLLPQGPFFGPVRLDCPAAPANVACRFNGQAAPATLFVSGMTEVIMQFMVGAATSPGSYSVAVTSTTPGRSVPTQSQNIELTVNSGAATSDLSVSFASPAQALLPSGAAASFQLMVANNGSAVSNAQVFLSFNPPVSVTSASVSAGSDCVGIGTLTSLLQCPIGAMAASDQRSISLIVQPALMRDLQIAATVNSDAVDSNLTNNSDSISIPVRLRPFARQGLIPQVP